MIVRTFDVDYVVISETTRFKASDSKKVVKKILYVCTVCSCKVLKINPHFGLNSQNISKFVLFIFLTRLWAPSKAIILKSACKLLCSNEYLDLMEIGSAVEAGLEGGKKGGVSNPIYSNAAQPPPLDRSKNQTLY